MCETLDAYIHVRMYIILLTVHALVCDFLTTSSGHLFLSPLLCTCISPPHLPATHRRPVPLGHSTLPHARYQTSASLSPPHCHTHHHGPHTSWSSSSLPGWEDKEGGREGKERGGEKWKRRRERRTKRQIVKFTYRMAPNFLEEQFSQNDII